MKNLELNFIQRLKIINLLSLQEGTLGKTAPFKRVLDLIRFNEEEDVQIVKTQVDATTVNYAAPTDFKSLLVDIENADATAVVTLMEEWQHFTPADHVWCDPMLKALR
jgi:flagellar assembly factor FliW